MKYLKVPRKGHIYTQKVPQKCREIKLCKKIWFKNKFKWHIKPTEAQIQTEITVSETNNKMFWCVVKMNIFVVPSYIYIQEMNKMMVNTWGIHHRVFTLFYLSPAYSTFVIFVNVNNLLDQYRNCILMTTKMYI